MDRSVIFKTDREHRGRDPENPEQFIVLQKLKK